jgi:energy-coupling factor transporter ATP-binding protein EcfA2
MDAPVDLLDLTAICRATPPRAGRTRVLAIDGPSGAGKTTFAGQLARALAPPEQDPAPIVHLDDLYPGWDGLSRTPELLRDLLLEPLANGRPAGFHRWDWAADQVGAWQPVPATDLLLLDGIGSGALLCAPYLSLLIWVDAPEPDRRRSALARDGDRYAPHWHRWARQEESYLIRDDPASRADLRIRVLPSSPPDPGKARRPPPSGGVGSPT